MLIGFIVVIVMILVIVGLMATGNSGGGTGVNQTKATKVVTEIGTLAQSLAFYKTTTSAGDYLGFNETKAVSLLGGYASNASIVESTLNNSTAAAGGFDVDGDGATTSTIANGLVSQAVPTLSYVFSTNSTSDSLVISVILGGTDLALDKAIGATVASKLNGGNMLVDATSGVAPAVAPATKYIPKDVLVVTTK